MSPKRAARSKVSARSAKRGVAKKIREILGASPRTSLDSLILEDAKRAQLLEICRQLGLRGTSRLRKDEIAGRIRRALQAEKVLPVIKQSAIVEKLPEEEKSEEESTPPVASPHAEHGWSRAEFQARKFSLDDQDRSLAHSASGSSTPKYIPWGYGSPRVGALPVDPERLFVYWEVTDDAVEAARRALGPVGAEARLNLRVYDTTGRLFDGTNAHSYIDHGVEMGSRQWFFDIGKPGSEAFVDIGLRAPNGGFCKIGRSGRVSFPRRTAAPHGESQWLTVRSLSEEPELVVATPGARPTTNHVTTKTPTRETSQISSSSGTAPVWHTVEEEGTETIWESSVWATGWESEAFSLSLDVPEPVWETYGGEVRTFEVDGRTHVVFGPWQVVVRGIGAYSGRRVRSRWTVYRSWAVEGKEDAQSARVRESTLGSSARLGGSERRLGAASELRLAGASELLYRGASERRFGGASERIYGGASERWMRGASERRFRGASERRLGGASELRLGGASERWTSRVRGSTSGE